MKKTLIPLFSLVLVFSLLFSITGTAAALPPPPPIPTTPSLPDPVVTPVSGDMEFTTEFIPIAQFPGTTEFNQMLVPVGFPAGEAQYEGSGIIVSGMDQGKATACFHHHRHPVRLGRQGGLVERHEVGKIGNDHHSPRGVIQEPGLRPHHRQRHLRFHPLRGGRLVTADK